MRAVITRTRARHQLGRPGALQAVRGHVVHLAVKAVVQPCEQAGLRRRPDRRRPRRSGKIRARGPRPAAARAAACAVDRTEDRALQSADSRNAATPHWPDEADCAACAARAGRARRACATPSSSCTARSAPARPPSCATCCARSASRAASRARPTRVMEPYERVARRLRRSAHFDFYRFDDPREWEDAGFRDVFAEPGPEARRMAREGRRRCCPRCDLRVCDRAARRRARRATLRLEALQRRAAGSCCA